MNEEKSNYTLDEICSELEDLHEQLIDVTARFKNNYIKQDRYKSIIQALSVVLIFIEFYIGITKGFTLFIVLTCILAGIYATKINTERMHDISRNYVMYQLLLSAQFQLAHQLDIIKEVIINNEHVDLETYNEAIAMTNSIKEVIEEAESLC